MVQTDQYRRGQAHFSFKTVRPLASATSDQEQPQRSGFSTGSAPLLPSLSPMREGDGVKFHRLAEESSTNGSMRRHSANEMLSMGTTVPSSGGLGKQSDGEGGHGSRCELAPNVDASIDLI